MLSLIILMIVISVSNGYYNNTSHYSEKCWNTSLTQEDTITFLPDPENVPARYILEWCTASAPKDYEWKVVIRYLVNTTKFECRPPTDDMDNDKVHSYSNQLVQNALNCPKACYSLRFDMIASGCYILKNNWEQEGFKISKKAVFVENEFPDVSYFENKTALVLINSQYDCVDINWQFQDLPVSDFKLSVYDMNMTMDQEVQEPLDATEQCMAHVRRRGVEASFNGITCYLKLPYKCYKFVFENMAYWTSGELFDEHHLLSTTYCHKEKSVVEDEISNVDSSRMQLWYILGSILVVLTLLFVLIWYPCTNSNATLHGKRILESWRAMQRNRIYQQRTSVSVEMPIVVETVNILLLYARDCDPIMRTIEILTTLLQRAINGKVYDINSAEVLSLSGGNPREWVRQMIMDPQVRVLLIHTPAAALYQFRTQHKSDPDSVSTALIGCNAVYRHPQYADHLLSYALQLIPTIALEQPHLHHHYTKYYIANIMGLTEEGLDLVMGVAPYTRYVLPSALDVMLHDISLVQSVKWIREPEDDALVAQYRDATQQVITYVVDHPNYLTEDIVQLRTS